MIRSICCAAVLMMVLPKAALAWQTATPDQTRVQPGMQVMAVVNGQQIDREHLAKETIRRFGEPVIEGMINNQLILEQCQAEGINVTAEDIDAELERRAAKFRMSTAAYVELIARERGVDEVKLRNEVVWTELALRRLAASQIQVGDEEIQAQLDSEFGPKVQVRVIAVETEDRARKVLAAAQANPEQFSRLAIDYSVDTNSASVGGLLPPLRRNMGDPEIENAAFALQVGQISPIIPIADQFIILKC